MDSDQGNWNAPQQIDGYTKLLLHMDGADAATTFPNSATTTHTVTANGNAQVDTAQSKFGGASGLFDGTGDYLSVPDSDDWAFGSGDFSIDFWVRFNSVAGTQSLIGQRGDAFSWEIILYAGGIYFWTENDAAFSVSGGSPVINTWYHIAVVRNGGKMTMYIGGTTVGTNTNAGTTSFTNVASILGIGIRTNNPTYSPLNGWLDELRVSKGIARWTSNFTPPPRAYGSNVKAENETTLKMEGTASTKLTLGAPQVDGNTVALWHFEETGTTTGTYLYDETANNNDATTTGTTVVDGIFGKARKFNGTSDYLSNNPPTSLPSGANARTVEAWAKVDSFGGGNTYIYSYGHNNCAGSDTFALGVTSAGKAYFAGCVDDLTGNAKLSTNQWYHLAATYDGTTVKMYVDGVLDNSAAKTLNTTVITSYIGAFTSSSSKFNGTIDEVKISNRALSPDEIAETYRMGANHHLTREVSAVDLSSANKLAFNIASDRPGTYLDVMLGESDYANYELASSTLALSTTTTVLYIKGDEIASSTSIKDSSFSGKAITANGNARTSGNGKIGNSVYFDGTGDYLTLANSTDWNLGAANGGNFTIDLWVNFSNVSGSKGIISAALTNGWQFYWENNNFSFWNGAGTGRTLSWTPSVNQWYHVALVRNESIVTVYVNGVRVGTIADGDFNNDSEILAVGATDSNGGNPFNGHLDELRILKSTALTADQIRQAYEYGLRSHQITTDFGATLQTSDLISNSTDYNFNITATTSGLSATTSGLYLGDKIIIKENLGGTEYTAQGTVNAINTTTGAITVPSWDTGSTFPASNGYSPNATVFKWQREYFDLTGAATTTRNAITNLTLRPTNGAEGRTIYLDDFRYNTNYLTASSSSAITSSNNRYLQYRAIFSSSDTFVSPFLSAFNTLYTALANSFPAIIGVSGGGFLSF